MNITYLGGPYTSPNIDIRIKRFHQITRAAAKLIKTRSIVIYSPITMTHPIDLYMAEGETMGSDFWVDFDETFMALCSGMIVLTLDGWEESKGLKREMAYFERLGKPIELLDYGILMGE